MIDNLIWHFPKSGFTTQSGSDKNDIDTFSDDRVNHLTREMIQNSIDAKIDNTVKIEFHLFKTSTNEFPALESFRDYLNSWMDNNIKLQNSDDKDYIFVKKALSQLSKKEIVWLRISDFNTHGLTGALSKDKKSAYFSFVHGAGINYKQNENSGGTKGTGKNSIFANSYIQTMFVSTYSKDNEKASIGISSLVSSGTNDSDEDWTQGIGYCVLDDELKIKNKPINKIINIDSNFNREKCGFGTDIYIPCFIDADTFFSSIIGSSIINFMPAILKNKLEVIVSSNLDIVDQNTNISSTNLLNLITQLSSFNSRNLMQTAKNIYNALTSSAKVKKKHNEKGFEMTLFLNKDEGSGDEKVYIYRCPTDMLIKTVYNSAYVKYSGVLLLEGDELTNKLKSIEDATHSKWVISNYNKTKYLKSELDDAIFKVVSFIERYASNFGNNNDYEEADFKYMVDNDWCSSSDEHEIAKEDNKDFGLPVPHVSFSIRNDPSKHAYKRPLKRKSNLENPSGEAESYIVETGNLGGESEGLYKEHESGQNSNSGSEMDGELNKNLNQDDSNNFIKLRKRVETIDIKMPSLSPKEGLFNLIFTPKSTGEEVEISIFIKGTGKEEIIPVDILKAKNGLFPLKIKNNIIYLKKITRGTKYKINLKLNVKRNYVWEVSLNANE